MEDTAFYRYGRLLSRNEVGSNPGQFALATGAFHSACALRGRTFPAALLATATHDHKRGEDVRARLAVLSGIPKEWSGLLRRWMRLNAPLRRHLDSGPAPAPADEMMLYQMLVGAWPFELKTDDRPGLQAFLERVAAWQEKALREAKHHTAWVAPDHAYESACRDFLFQSLAPTRTVHLADEIAAFVGRIGPAGAANSLAQTVLRLTVPGVPDLYQGTEWWDFSLVDPDNRRPVDFAARDAAIADADPASMAYDPQTWQDGRIKHAVIARALALRKRRPDLFAMGRYSPLNATGPAAGHVLAFARQHGEARAVVAVLRLPERLLGAEGRLAPTPDSLRGTRLALPRGWGGHEAVDVLGGQRLTTAPTLPANALFSRLPVVILEIG
jgi:(1->4)-alpha-D-glucan 1-alpha-D-glucosylmutase